MTTATATAPADLKRRLGPFRAALAAGRPDGARDAVMAAFAPDAVLQLCHPFGDVTGGAGVWDVAFGPLSAAMPDLERRDMIVMAGRTAEGAEWVGCMGNYMGTFAGPFLGIPPTGHLAHMRYHEFYRIADDRITEAQIIWDIPELMMQAGAWPMAPQLGAFLCTPAPMSGDGLAVSGDGAAALAHVQAMLTDLCRHPADPDPAVMRLDHYWHPACLWYGPAGIGTARGIAGFRSWHQIPFLRAMPDRRVDASADLASHWLAEGDYVCETGWPNMRLTLSHDGWLGIAPAGREITLRSLDFWRLEGGLIRENWVLVDLLDAHQQTGVDVLARMRDYTRARVPGRVPFPIGDPPR